MGVHVFQDVMSYENICLKGGYAYSISCNVFYFTGRHFLLVDMFYLRVCIIVGHVL